MSMHASIGRGETRGRCRCRLEKYPGTARVAPLTSTDAAGESAVDLVGIDRVLRTFYAAFSGPPAQQRWHQFRALFEPGSWMRSADGSELPIEQLGDWSPEHAAEVLAEHGLGASIAVAMARIDQITRNTVGGSINPMCRA